MITGQQDNNAPSGQHTIPNAKKVNKTITNQFPILMERNVNSDVPTETLRLYIQGAQNKYPIWLQVRVTDAAR